jgi:hypothetical protein
MRAFETFLNGRRLCVAGIDGDSVLTVIIDCARRDGRDAELELNVGGLDSAAREHVTWATTQLQVGDEVQVKVLESVSADEPSIRKRPDPENETEMQRNYVRQMAKKWGWTLDERPS